MEKIFEFDTLKKNRISRIFYILKDRVLALLGGVVTTIVVEVERIRSTDEASSSISFCKRSISCLF